MHSKKDEGFGFIIPTTGKLVLILGRIIKD
jgi:hypothetical protein